MDIIITKIFRQHIEYFVVFAINKAQRSVLNTQRVGNRSPKFKLAGSGDFISKRDCLLCKKLLAGANN